MTSTTGPSKRAPAAREVGAARRGAGPSERRAQPRPAFTLLELVLVLGLVALLVGVAVANFAAVRRGRTLERAAERLATAFRMARADAANLGRRLRIAFDAEGGPPSVLWEPDPLGAPGEFVDYAPRCTWRALLDLEGVWVESSRLTGPSAYRYLLEAAGAAGPALDPEAPAPITFEPDGTADTAVVVLAAVEAPEGRRARLELVGLTGRVRVEVLGLDELEAREAAAEEPSSR